MGDAVYVPALPPRAHQQRRDRVRRSPLTCGVYQITFPNGAFYIGSSRRIEIRWQTHRSEMKTGRHINHRLRNHFNKFGFPNFKVLLVCREQDLTMYELICMNALSPTLNLSPLVGRPDFSAETRAKISKANKGRPSQYKGVPMSEETRRKMSVSSMGMLHSEETKAKMRAAQLGRVVSEETRKRLSESGSKYRWSPERRAAEAIRRKGKKPAALVRYGKHSEESKAKMSEGMRRAWERRRNG